MILQINDQQKKTSNGTFSADLDMYADDFDEKEKAELTTPSTSKASLDTDIDESEGIYFNLKSLKINQYAKLPNCFVQIVQVMMLNGR